MSTPKNDHRTFRRRRREAVSPLIATILLVAISVVLGAVLYLLISNLSEGPGEYAHWLRVRVRTVRPGSDSLERYDALCGMQRSRGRFRLL